MTDPPDAFQIREWNEKISRAKLRCEQVASTETVWGYDDSAKVYRDMANEIDEVKWWVMVIYGPPRTPKKKTECSSTSPG